MSGATRKLMSDYRWRVPLLRSVRDAIRTAKRIDYTVLQSVALETDRPAKNWGILKNALDHLAHDHPDDWQEHRLLGSYLKRLEARLII